MRIHCPSCDTGYDFPVELLADPPIAVRCMICLTDFLVGHEGVLNAPARVFERVEPALGEPAPPTPPPLPQRQDDPTPPLPEVPAEVAARDLGEGHPTETTTLARVVPVKSAQPTESQMVDAAGSVRLVEGATYMVVGGKLQVSEGPRRRVVHTKRDGEGPAPRARVVAHAATFRRPRWRSREAAASGALRGPAAADDPLAPTPPGEVGQPASVSPPTSQRAQWFVAAALILAVAGVVSLTVTIDPSDRVGQAPSPGRPPPPSAADEVAEAPAPVRPVLAAELLEIEPLPHFGAAVVRGQIANGTQQAKTRIQLVTTLFADGKPLRRRTVWCCDDLTGKSAREAAGDPKHPHFERNPGKRPLRTVAPGEVVFFSTIFPSIGRETLDKELDALIELTVSTDVTSN